jgi:hypothetical protein
LLWRLLPYPGCFVSADHLALALRVNPKQLRALLENDVNLLRKTPLERIRYKGILAGFYGPCWWAAGIDHLLWTLTAGKKGDKNRLNEIARKWLGRKISTLAEASPVLLSDEFGVSDGETADASEAIRIMPRGWPTGSPWPWTKIATVRADPLLKALAVPDDLRAAEIT